MASQQNLAELIADQCVEHAELEVLTFVDVGPDNHLVHQKRTFAELRERAKALAVWMRTMGVKPGDRFALMMNNHPEFVEAMVAASLVGAVFVPIDPRTMGEKLAYMLDFSECSGVIAADYALPALAQIASRLDRLHWVLKTGDGAAPTLPARIKQASYAAAMASADPAFVATPADAATPMFMMFTSGTTGNPKAVVRAHGAYMAGMEGLMLFGAGPGDILYTGLPLSHVNAQTTLAAGLSLALPVVISCKFTKSRLWDICRAYGCTVFNLLGGMIPEMFSIPEKPDDADNPVRLIISAGMPATLWDAYRRRFGVEICEIYGSTEGGGVLFNLPGSGPVGSMGKPLMGQQAMVFNAAGEPCQPFEPGELCFRPEGGTATPVAYYKNEAAGAEKVSNGWFRSGDIAHMDAEGFFFFHHRVGGGVRRNGNFVNTALVESVLASAPMIEDVFVYGVATPANVAGEKTLVAAVKVLPGTDVAALRDFCRGKLERADVPEIFQIVSEIPKTSSEKPIEKACIALLEQAGLIKPDL